MSGGARGGRRQRSLHCAPEEQEMIRTRAKSAGKPISRYVLDLALADDPDVHPVALDAEAQFALLDGVLDVLDFVRALGDELPGGSGQSLLSAISAMAADRAP